MTSTATPLDAEVAVTLAQGLRRHRRGPFLGTPCGVLAPLYRELEAIPGVVTVAREDSAAGVAAGAALAGDQPVVLMQNSGFGQAVNVFASLIVPYRLDVLTVISLRGVAPDDTEENQGMGVLTPVILDRLGVPVRRLDDAQDVLSCVDDWPAADQGPCFLLVAPGLFGWRP